MTKMRDVVIDENAKSQNLSDWNGLNVLVISPTPTHPKDFGNRKRVFEICEML